MMGIPDIGKYYNRLKKHLNPSFHSDLEMDNIFRCHLVSAFSKCFEFNLLVHKKSSTKNSFFLTPSLRGICEDLITLKFLKRHKVIDSNKLLLAYTQLQLAELSDIQIKFFKKNHGQQIVFEMQNSEGIKEEMSNSLKDEWKKIGFNQDKKLPSVSHMSIDAGLKELYEYLYAATSDMVHFSPHNLLRSGWNKNENHKKHYFSTDNFHKYYDLFNKFYGTYLFIAYYKHFKKELRFSKEVKAIINDLITVFELEARWPELITFEEMNHPDAEKVRLINTIRKIRLTANGFKFSEEQTEELVKDFLDKAIKNRMVKS